MSQLRVRESEVGPIPSLTIMIKFLFPVTALPTSEGEAQLGLAKVAEADLDAFMTYAAIVPEYCRLEGMLCKSLV